MKIKKKTVLLSIVLTLFFVIAPAFLVDLEKNSNPTTVDIQKYDDEGSANNEAEANNGTGSRDNILNEEVVTTFSSNTCFKKTYYINNDNVKVYKSSDGKNTLASNLKKEDAVVAYKEENGYVYCEDNFGNFGWIKKTANNLTGNIQKDSKYKIDISLRSQILKVTKDDKVVKQVKCSTGIIGDAETETPIGVFKVQLRGTSFYSTKYKEGARYYLKFFSNYLIHSIPTDEKNNIIKEEEKKLGFPVSHGCIRIGMSDSKWLYDNVPDGSMVSIHY